MATDHEKLISEGKALKALCAFMFVEIAERSKNPIEELDRMIDDLKRLTQNPPGPNPKAFTRAIDQVIAMAQNSLPD